MKQLLTRYFLSFLGFLITIVINSVILLALSNLYRNTPIQLIDFYIQNAYIEIFSNKEITYLVQIDEELLNIVVVYLFLSNLIIFLILIYTLKLRSIIILNILQIFLLFIFGLVVKNFPIVMYLLTNIFNLINLLYYFNIYQKSEKTFLQNILSKYIDKSFVQKIISNPEKIKSIDSKVMTVMFSDLRNFTNFTEKMTYKEIHNFMNQYLNHMTQIINSYKGVVDKYIGDAIMAYWNGINVDKYHMINATLCALSMIEKIEKIKFKNNKITLGIGIVTGEMSIGNIGENKLSLTVLGDNVNLASRLEGLTKKYGVKIITNYTTYNLKIRISGVIWRKLDIVKVKGKEQATEIFEPMRNTSENYKLAYLYNKGINLMFKQKLDEALKFFEKISIDDKPTKMMIDRIKSFKNTESTLCKDDLIMKWDEK